MKNSDDSPLVSCILPVHNDNGGFLDLAIQSILNQTFEDFEFIIVANACTDEFWANLNKYNDHRIRLFRTTIGQQAFNINYGLNESKGRYIARMDADDISLPERFEKQVKYLNENVEVGVLGTAHQEIDEFGNKGRIFRPPKTDVDIRNMLFYSSPLSHPTIMFRKTLLLKNSGYMYRVDDYDLWLRMRRTPDACFGNLDEVLLLYRRHAGQFTAQKNGSINAYSIAGLLLREFLITKNPKFLLGLARTMISATSFVQNMIKPVFRWIKRTK